MQPFIKLSCESRALRLWVKAFLELMPAIVKEYKDAELVELLLFQLPWMCYGLGSDYRVNSAGAIVRKNDTQIKGLNDNTSVGFRSNLSGTIGPTSVFSVPTLSDANMSQDNKALAESQQSHRHAVQPLRPFGPSYIHGQQFELFSKLCFAVIPL